MNRATEDDYPMDWILTESAPLDITEAERLDCKEDRGRMNGLRAAFLLFLSVVGGVLLFGLTCAAYFMGAAQ